MFHSQPDSWENMKGGKPQTQSELTSRNMTLNSEENLRKGTGKWNKTIWIQFGESAQCTLKKTYLW